MTPRLSSLWAVQLSQPKNSIWGGGWQSGGRLGPTVSPRHAGGLPVEQWGCLRCTCLSSRVGSRARVGVGVGWGYRSSTEQTVSVC